MAATAPLHRLARVVGIIEKSQGACFRQWLVLERTESLPLARVLAEELGLFRVKVTALASSPRNRVPPHRVSRASRRIRSRVSSAVHGLPGFRVTALHFDVPSRATHRAKERAVTMYRGSDSLFEEGVGPKHA